MPIGALASAMVRSAAAMSGRRSSSSEGTPTGIGGGATVMGFTGMEKFVAALPTSMAMACSYWARAIPTLVAPACALCSVVSASTTEIWSSMPVS